MLGGGGRGLARVILGIGGSYTYFGVFGGLVGEEGAVMVILGRTVRWVAHGSMRV